MVYIIKTLHSIFSFILQNIQRFCDYQDSFLQKKYLSFLEYLIYRSQWPCGLKHELSSPTRTLGSWVRITLEVRMPVCIYSVLVFLCV
jgi:hypothetical protein